MAVKDHTPASQQLASQMHVPQGRTLADLPKGAPIAPPTGAAKKPNSRLTLRQFLTESETKEYLVPYLVELGRKRSKGPWKDYLGFYQANMSADMDSMSPEIYKKCEKIIKDINDEYFREQDL